MAVIFVQLMVTHGGRGGGLARGLVLQVDSKALLWASNHPLPPKLSHTLHVPLLGEEKKDGAPVECRGKMGVTRGEGGGKPAEECNGRLLKRLVGVCGCGSKEEADAQRMWRGEVGEEPRDQPAGQKDHRRLE